MHSELHVAPNIYNRPFPRFQRPNVIGYIGLENVQFARNICDKPVKYDLNLHIDKAKRKPEDLDVKLTELLKFLLEHERRLNFPLENDIEKAKFFCYRGLMTCIACTPYENREPWKIMVILHKGNIYLCARDTEDKLKRKLNMTDKEKMFTSWGYKFEQFILSDAPNSDPNPNIPVDETKEFSLVFTTSLNRHTVVYGAEMDGIRCDKAPVPPLPKPELRAEAIVDYLATKEFIELKTNRHIEFPNQENSFRRFKTKKWWCQSFLVGVDTILCGFRNDDGIVEELKTFHVKDLPKMSQRFWNPNVCFNFLDTFLTYVKRCLIREIKQKYGQGRLMELQTLPMITLLLEWQPKAPVQVIESYHYEDDPILPQWYLDNYGKNVDR
ncbi:decapping and exoribonuclease protein-like [Pectinophora gossypiella]|uniref:decapping and exoribonuclease protein-like n=1 Tax=Pectinophora gossypiella TaxID=13191 RepID=UPI00214EB05E|nr:decapping and exoribonuclease protein-like [Pectinophora gossypiella]